MNKNEKSTQTSGGREVAGSSPVIPTQGRGTVLYLFLFFVAIICRSFVAIIYSQSRCFIELDFLPRRMNLFGRAGGSR